MTESTPGAQAQTATEAPARLDVLKALGDNTRYAIYLELARAPAPLSTSDIAETLDLHVNTVRPHLERMRDVGLLDVHTGSTGGVGRPQHRYAINPSAPALGLEPPLFPTLARMLVKMAVEVGADADDARAAGHEQGRHDARDKKGDDAAVELFKELDRLGFDPQVVVEEDQVTLGFSHCPFQDLAEANPEVVCGLHRGMVEGFVGRVGGCVVQEFRTLVDRNACQVDLVDN
ncbi:MAG: helix-turn-helix transcriptional regulator [Acidimicrobiales bacterium]